MRLIDADAAIDALHGYLVGKRCPDDGTLTCRLIENEVINKLPAVQPEHMHTVMLKIAEKYEKAMNTSCILNPMAWALYQTWKEYDR